VTTAIISAAGLSQDAIASLTQHLQSVNLPKSVSGEIVLDFPIKDQHVGRIILDDQVSTLKDSTVVDLIKRSLVTWMVTESVNGNVRLKLRILPSDL
jgi:Ca-activated chloride channel family protein